MCLIKSFWEDLKASPIQTINRWQDARFLWIVMAIAMFGLVIVAHSIFQNYIYMKPCEQCVYIRFSMIVMAIGGIVAAINPKQIFLKIIGYVFAFYGAIIGMIYCIKLNDIHHAVHGDDPFGVQGCSTDPNFPFGLPLAQWAPDWFQPTGDCGYDNPIVPDGVTLSGLQQWLVDFYADGWYLIPKYHFMNMAQACFIAYALAFVLLFAMAVSWIISSLKAKKN